VSGHFYALLPGKSPGTHLIGCWVGPRSGKDAVMTKISAPAGSRTPVVKVEQRNECTCFLQGLAHWIMATILGLVLRATSWAGLHDMWVPVTTTRPPVVEGSYEYNELWISVVGILQDSCKLQFCISVISFHPFLILHVLTSRPVVIAEIWFGVLVVRLVDLCAFQLNDLHTWLSFNKYEVSSEVPIKCINNAVH